MDELLNKIKSSLFEDKDFSYNDDLGYNKQISQIYIALFQEGLKPIRWGSKKETFTQTIKRII